MVFFFIGNIKPYSKSNSLPTVKVLPGRVGVLSPLTTLGER